MPKRFELQSKNRTEEFDTIQAIAQKLSLVDARWFYCLIAAKNLMQRTPPPGFSLGYTLQCAYGTIVPWTLHRPRLAAALIWQFRGSKRWGRGGLGAKYVNLLEGRRNDGIHLGRISRVSVVPLPLLAALLYTVRCSEAHLASRRAPCCSGRIGRPGKQFFPTTGLWLRCATQTLSETLQYRNPVHLVRKTSREGP